MNLIKNNLLTVFFLAVILLFALFIRVYSLSSVPLGFHIDEASLGYNGYSLLLTGKDENNHKLPLYIDMFGDNRPSGYHYLTTVSIKFLGLSEFSTRLPGALFGAFSVIVLFFLVQVLFKNKKISLVAALLLAASPWHIVLSRASAEAIVALFFIISGYTLVLISFQNKRIFYCIFGILLLILSFFFYHAPRVFVPLLFFVSLLYLYPLWKKFAFKYKLTLVIGFLITSLVAFSLVFLINGGTGRFSQVNIFGFPEVRLVLEEQIRESGIMGQKAFDTRIFHNKIINYSLAFASNYLDYFSGRFLFIEGGLPVWYKVPGMGLVYILELPFILLGVFYLFNSKDKYHKLALLWLLTAPVTSAFTIDDVPNINRALVMLPMIELTAAYGFVSFTNRFSNIKYKVIISVFAFLFLFNFLYFVQQYFVISQVHRNWYRDEGFSELVALIKKDYKNYDKIIVTKSYGGVYPLILFYMQYDPSSYQAAGSSKDKEDTGFGKFFFVPAGCPSKDGDPKTPIVNKYMFIDNGNCPDYKGLSLLKHTFVLRKDGTKVFRIVYE